MNANLPVPERTLPRESAARIRSTIMFAEPDRDRPTSRWMLGLAAAVVVIALLATAVVLWPGTSRTQVVATPTPIATASATPTDLDSRFGPTPPESPGPPSTQEPFETDQGALSAASARRVIEECVGKGKATGRILAGRRASNGKQTFKVVLYRAPDGRVWQCSAGSSFTPLEDDGPNGPNASFPIVTEPGSQSADQEGTSAEWIYRALPTVRRVQVRALVEGRSTRWFEGEVREGLAFVPTFTAGRFGLNDGSFPVVYEHRAFDADGREISVKVIGPR
jgi:hypothetical protein